MLITLLTIGFLSCLAVSLIAYQFAESAISNRIRDHLTSLRVTRASQVEKYMESIRAQVRTFGSDLTVVQAVNDFRKAIDDIQSVKPGESCQRELTDFYEQDFVPRLDKNTVGKPVLKNLLPVDPITCELQHRYVVPAGFLRLSDDGRKLNGSTDDLSSDSQEQQGLDAPEAESQLQLFEQTHDKYHDHFSQLLNTFRYYDVFLIDAETLRVIYSVGKEVDFATSLLNGPYSSSNLAKVVRQVANSDNHQFTIFSDFSFYSPSYGAPAAFIAAPVYEQNKRIGIVAIQFPIDEIDRIMTGDQNWEANGLGESGEVYLVGPDRRMRSDSRFLLTNLKEYVRDLKSAGVAESTVNQVEMLNTTILLQQVDTEATREAFNGTVDTRQVDDYRGMPVLSSFEKLNIEGLDWVLLAEMDVEEAFRPLTKLRNAVIFGSAGLLLLVTLFAMLLAGMFTRPINRFISEAHDVADGSREELCSKPEDEFGTLAVELNKMVSGLKNETELAHQETKILQDILHVALPSHVTERLRSGDSNIVEPHANIAVVCVRIDGWNQSHQREEDGVAMQPRIGGQNASVREGAAQSDVLLLSEFVSLLDNIGSELGIEKVATMDGRYIATCGVGIQRLDHVRRIAEFAQAITEKISWFNAQKSIELDVGIGIGLGPIVEGVIGRQNVIYDIWGAGIDDARRVSDIADNNEILVTSDVAEALQEVVTFEAASQPDVFLLVPHDSGERS
ncbi:cache domain-containing protein [Mariniblastus sp.]|nr:cache domain-containing protein [Mariniblastus sp.]